MNSEERTCDAHRDELSRLACDETAAPSVELREHLAGCVSCRRELAAKRRLLNDLGRALEPEPLSNELAARITGCLSANPRGRQIRWSIALRLAGTAAAACLLVAFLVHRGTQPGAPVDKTPDRIELTEGDESAIAEAYALLLWESADYSVDSLSERVEQAAQALGRAHGGSDVLPWSADDDWDVPQTSTESSRLGVARPVCSRENPDDALSAGAARAVAHISG